MQTELNVHDSSVIGAVRSREFNKMTVLIHELSDVSTEPDTSE